MISPIRNKYNSIQSSLMVIKSITTNFIINTSIRAKFSEAHFLEWVWESLCFETTSSFLAV